MADWASHRNLQHAVMLGIRNPEAALNNLRPFINFDAAYSFVLTQRPTWQEVAVTDGRRLILWHGSETECAGHDNRLPHPMFQSSVRTVLLSRLSDQALHTDCDVLPDGSHELVSVRLRLYTPTVNSTTRTTPEDSQHYVECYLFDKNADDGQDEMGRLLEFAAALSISTDV